MAGDGWGLAHRRLTIIDLSDAGRQPMLAEEGRVRLIFNGEIYNFTVLRDRLQSAGYAFRSTTDTEVLLHGYLEWGFHGLLEWLNGMFAFAIHDARSGELHLARDPFGKKPLFYQHDSTGFRFASNLMALEHALPERRLNARAVPEFLEFTVIPERSCIYEGVHKVLPGHGLTLTEAGIEQRPYWRLETTPKLDISLEDARAGVCEHMIRAVERRLYSDVPIGAFLSGGVDSSLVCWAIRELRDDLDTFTISMVGSPLDEVEYANEIAIFLGTRQQVLEVDPNQYELVERITEACSEPFGDSSALPSLLVSELARRHVTVVLTGDGGDELFAGYDYVRFALEGQRLRERAGMFGTRAAYAASGALSGLPRGAGRRMARLHRVAGNALHGITGQLRQRSRFDRLREAGAIGPVLEGALERWHPAGAKTALFDTHPADSEAERCLWHDMQFHLPSDYLTKVDSATMYHSLEARCPMLDIELWQYPAKFPTEVRMPNGRRKGLLTDTALDVLPSRPFTRPKQGFSIPIHQWLRGQWQPRWQELFTNSRAQELGLVNDAGVHELLERHAGGETLTRPLWSLGQLELWLRKRGIR